MSDPSFSTALITGASSGIGAALAKLLAAEGTEVVLVARREQALREQAEAITSAGGKARIEVLDVSDPERTEARIRELDEALGLELVVANAGVGNSRWGGKLAWNDCRKVIAVNVCGAVATLTGAIPGMVARGRGHLVGVSSIAQYRGLPSSASYCASKAFLSTFLESLRVDLHATGVAVTDVRPGFVDTPMTEDMKSKPFSIEVDKAARIIARGVRSRRKVVAFPAPMKMIGHMLQLMPKNIYEPAVRRGKK
ncbi:3-oxoacyl-[acyl-carrier-protein] reductase FabG [Enhygromyxa salina]|uniref:3-oxoacyl-[acyl-carrier-protein] reductase FabG n=1 Tax=Enhygromyxa salina TaxID=215803 RepID=A0A2S9XBU0_9BACT|nr:SDR family NAD(P)-dependent oxidoreductase [Enhygromyxa salina]PRP90270.1 3-oxoacyl-[acyl-carrier-protein] reductase FabG [Enhygromyxa salina]